VYQVGINKGNAPTCFGPYLQSSSGGSWAVLYAVNAHEPPEDGHKCGPKQVGTNFLKCSKCWCELMFLKCGKAFMGWNKRNNCNNMHGATIKIDSDIFVFK